MRVDYCNPKCGCRPKIKITDQGHMSLVQKVCYALEVLGKVVGVVNGFGDELDQKEDSVNITNNRRLSGDGDFTGTLDGTSIPTIKANIQSNTDDIYILSQNFEQGQTGRFIDGGNLSVLIGNVYDGGIL